MRGRPIKEGDTKLWKLLNKYLLMVTFEDGKHYSVRFKISNYEPKFDLWIMYLRATYT